MSEGRIWIIIQTPSLRSGVWIIHKKVNTFEIHMKFKFHKKVNIPLKFIWNLNFILDSNFVYHWNFSKVKIDKIAIARSICLGIFWTRKETPLKINFRLGLFSDKNWLELIWASYGKFVVFFICKKRQNWRSSLNLPRIFWDQKRDPP